MARSARSTLPASSKPATSSWSASGSTRSRGRAAAPPGPDRGAAHPSRRRTPPFPPQSLTCTCPAPHHVGWQAAGIGLPLLQGHEQGKVGERQSLPAAHRHRLLLLGRCRPSSCPWPATAGPAPPPAARCHTPGTAGRRGCRTADRGCGTPGSASRSSAGCTDGRRQASASSCSSALVEACPETAAGVLVGKRDSRPAGLEGWCGPAALSRLTAIGGPPGRS
jgi:hypothetical protein